MTQYHRKGNCRQRRRASSMSLEEVSLHGALNVDWRNVAVLKGRDGPEVNVFASEARWSLSSCVYGDPAPGKKPRNYFGPERGFAARYGPHGTPGWRRCCRPTWRGQGAGVLGLQEFPAGKGGDKLAGASESPRCWKADPGSKSAD